MTISHSFDVADWSGTESFGRRLGALLAPGTVVGLFGPLGAGKTHLTRAIAEGLKVLEPGAVNSPTFVLIQEYAGPVPLYHFDAYRLLGPREFLDLGVEEYFAGSGVCVIEWADRVLDALPADRLILRIEVLGATARRFVFSGDGKRSCELVRKLLSES